MKKYVLCAAMAVVMALPGMSSVAAAEEMKKGGRFAKIDTNGDGKVDLNEFKNRNAAKMEAAFKEADANGDGALTPEEWRNARKARKGK